MTFAFWSRIIKNVIQVTIVCKTFFNRRMIFLLVFSKIQLLLALSISLILELIHINNLILLNWFYLHN